MKKTTLLTGLLILAPQAQSAMHINEGGLGQVLIYPYYTVNNDLNTLYTVVNTTPDTKAIKVRFLEGENGAEVLVFNVYLDGHDVWQGALVPTTSTITGHVGEDTGLHVHNDSSCTPQLNTTQQFLPYIIGDDTENNNLRRATDGHIEVIEMATFSGNTINFADHGVVGFPNFCDGIEDDWDNGAYDLGDEAPVSGGLMGHASIINVANGQSVGYQAIAIDGFWTDGIGWHTEPAYVFPNIASGSTNTTMALAGQILTATWPSGARAITALLMQHSITNEYQYDPFAQGRSEWVVGFPTKRFLVRNTARPPFSNAWDGHTACDSFVMDVWDRSQQIPVPARLNQPRGSGPAFCYQTNVIEFLAPGQQIDVTSSILGSDNLLTVTGPTAPTATTNGWGRITFDQFAQTITPVSGSGLLGLPAVGFQVQQFTNGAAQPGLTARYLSIQNHHGKAQTASKAASNQEVSQ